MLPFVLVLSAVLTVLACIFVLPKRNRENLNDFLRDLHDLCNFKALLVEKIFKVLYIFCTVFAIFVGLFIFISEIDFAGLLIAILGPIVIRIVFELMMMFVISVENIVEINNKLTSTNSNEVLVKKEYKNQDRIKLRSHTASSGREYGAYTDEPDYETITVSFNTSGGSEISPITVKKGECAIAPDDPSRDGYTFVGWTLDGKVYTFDSAVTKNITLVATWELYEEFLCPNCNNELFFTNEQINDNGEFVCPFCNAEITIEN